MLDSDPRTAASGVWCTMFFIYMTYTLLALHLQECAVAGFMLAITQLAAAAGLNYHDPNMGKQVKLSTHQWLRSGWENHFFYYSFYRQKMAIFLVKIANFFWFLKYSQVKLSTSQ